LASYGKIYGDLTFLGRKRKVKTACLLKKHFLKVQFFINLNFLSTLGENSK